MSDAHLPNSHPDVTPGWEDYEFPRTGLPEAIKTKPVEGSNGDRYSGSVPLVWCANAGRTLSAHGGYCATVLMTTARQYNWEKHQKLAHTEPLNLFVEFLHPLPAGPFEVALETLQAGNRGSTIQAKLLTGKGQKQQTCSIAIIRFGVLQDEGYVHNVQPPIRPVPDREKECVRWTNALTYQFNPPTAAVRVYTPRDSGTPLWSEKYGGRNVRYQWTKMDDEDTFRLEHIPILADLIPVMPLNYAEDGILMAARYRIPTTCLQITFHAPLNNDEWLVTRTTMERLYAGRFDMKIQMYDEQENLVASCVNLCAMIPQSKEKARGKL
ncbi:hypothetical protein NCS57_01408100 [Fusarium keratoplasticum]|uniref:Uncharacterized protein n=1 Tax=Fusarium keratoplasticum TaxID=1328300 RepID=A0ACC0QER2_9HYPO|nr:hypothetical protein NCS57_01408100 [Fusarium keratoplasticum]KAI8650735.1 hypothetical protein NCS57_01408100 [Fusarium keratoplasticum]KAI8651535.1 hypothetical protein NCS55_01398700 [Fusarium keratoplasticum]